MDTLLESSSSIDPLGSSARRERVISLVAVTVVTLVGTCLRCWQCNESLWLDELHTAWTVDGGFDQIGHRALAGNYGPVYFWLPWLSTRLFGLHECSLRLPSLIAGIVLIPVAYCVTIAWFRSRSLGFLAAALIATDPHMLFYSVDARPYALVQLGAVLHVCLLVRQLSQPCHWFESVAYCCFGAALFHLHYTTGLLFIGESVLMAVSFAQGKQAHLRTTLAWTGATAVLCLTAIGNVQQIATRRELWNQFIERQVSFWGLFPFAEYLLPAFGALGICWLIEYCVNRAHVSGSASEKTSDDTPAAHDVGGPSNCQSKLAHSLTWCLVWLLVPIVLAFGLTRSDIARLFYRRYMMFSYPALVLLTAGIGSFCKTRRSRFAYTVILLFALNALFGPWQQFMTDGRFVRHSHEDWRGAVAELNAHLESDAVQEDARLTQTRRLPVLIRAGLVEERLMETPADITASREYLLFPVSSIYRLHARGETLCVQTDPLDIQSHAMVSMLSITDSTRHELENAQGCWLIVRGVKWFDANSANLLTQLRNWFGVRANDEYQVVWEKRKDFGNVVVVRCQIDRRSIDRRSN